MSAMKKKTTQRETLPGMFGPTPVPSAERSSAAPSPPGPPADGDELEKPTLDAAASRRLRDEGIARSYAAAGDDFRDRALRAVETVARRQEFLLPDDVWPALEGGGARNNKALGGVMRRARSLGWIELTDRVTRTSQKRSHGSYVVYWRSLIYRG